MLLDHQNVAALSSTSRFIVLSRLSIVAINPLTDLQFALGRTGCNLGLELTLVLGILFASRSAFAVLFGGISALLGTVPQSASDRQFPSIVALLVPAFEHSGRDHLLSVPLRLLSLRLVCGCRPLSFFSAWRWIRLLSSSMRFCVAGSHRTDRHHFVQAVRLCLNPRLPVLLLLEHYSFVLSTALASAVELGLRSALVRRSSSFWLHL